MKILFYADTVFSFGGVQRVLGVIANKFATVHDVTILSTDTKENLSMYGYNQSDIRFDYISYNGKKNIEYFTCKSIRFIYKKILKIPSTKNRYKKKHAAFTMTMLLLATIKSNYC